MSISDENKTNAFVEKLANSLVLGTSASRLVGSSPTKGTISYVSCFVACCVNRLINNKGKEKLASRLDFCTRTSLRN